MKKDELEKRITDKVLEAFALLREYDPECRELYMSIHKNSKSTYEVRANNDAYKNDCKPLMLIKYVTDKALDFKPVDIDLTDIDNRDKALESYDKAMKEVVKAAEQFGSEEQAKVTKIALSTMREVYSTQMDLDRRLL